MRVLFCTLPQKTHFLTLVPLAWALRTAGHDVRVASLPQFNDTITQAGLTAMPVGRAVDPGRLDRPEQRALARRGIPAPYDVAGQPAGSTRWADMKEAYRAVVPFMFEVDNFPMIADLVAAARAWRPDLVLWEPFTYAAPIAARACGAAHGRVLFTMDVIGVTHGLVRRFHRDLPAEEHGDVLVDWLSRYAGKYGVGFTEDMVSGQFTVDQLPASLRLQADLHYVPVRYVPYGGPAVVPSWLWQRPRRPRVGLTMGLSATEHFDGYTFRPGQLLDALAELDVEVVATIAESEQARLGAVPDNARVVPYVPLHALVPTCAAVVHHGGFGTLSTIASYGVPQLVLPYHFEGPLLADRLVARGAGLAIHSDRVTGEAVRDAVVRLLSEPQFTERAIDLQAEIQALPTPNDLVSELERLTTKYRLIARDAP